MQHDWRSRALARFWRAIFRRNACAPLASFQSAPCVAYTPLVFTTIYLSVTMSSFCRELLVWAVALVTLPLKLVFKFPAFKQICHAFWHPQQACSMSSARCGAPTARCVCVWCGGWRSLLLLGGDGSRCLSLDIRLTDQPPPRLCVVQTSIEVAKQHHPDPDRTRGWVVKAPHRGDRPEECTSPGTYAACGRHIAERSVRLCNCSFNSTDACRVVCIDQNALALAWRTMHLSDFCGASCFCPRSLLPPNLPTHRVAPQSGTLSSLCHSS